MIDKKEHKIIELIKKITNIDKVIDVGGFHGDWTDMILNDTTSSSIKIFEPDFNNFQVLKSKFSNNSRTELVNIGLSSEESNLIYHDLVSNSNSVRGMSGFVNREIYKNYEVQKKLIKVNRLDKVHQEDVDFLKIDTEGFEFNVLKGCEKLLIEKKIKFIQFEYGGTYKDANFELNDVISLLSGFGYKVYDIQDDDSLIEIDEFIDDYQYNNFISTYLKIN